MTPEIFVKTCEAYFGQYRPAVRKAVYDYVAQMGAGYRARLWQAVKMGHPYNSPPNVAVIEQFASEVDEVRELEEDTSRLIEELPVDKSEAARFLTGMLRAMKRGTHPSAYYERWERGE